jgi:hypothetical protein
MIVYSRKIIRFLSEIKHTIKNILSKEIGLKVGASRFYDRRQRASYPLKVLIFNKKGMLGYFEADFYELGFHKCLMQTTAQHQPRLKQKILKRFISIHHL